jgi:LacI family transcriptional regulator, galactose operon repressor
MAVTIHDVARLSHVSVATAARALGGYGYVSAGARARVEDAARTLGYVPNSLARALASGVTGVIGLVVGDIENPFFAAAARGLADVVEKRGYTLLLANSDEDEARERAAVAALRSRRVDGLVVTPHAGSASPHLRAAVESTPVVLLDRTVRGLGVDAVTVDNAAGARAATEHLLAHGHRRIGIVMDEPVIASSAERLRGYRAALAAAGAERDRALVSVGGSSRAGGYRAASALLALAPRPTAIFSADNFMTVGTMHALRDAGLRVPRDVSVVGFDDLEWTTLIDPPLTVVAQPAGELGGEAGRRILARIDGATGRPRRIRLETELILRGSVAPPR